MRRKKGEEVTSRPPQRGRKTRHFDELRRFDELRPLAQETRPLARSTDLLSPCPKQRCVSLRATTSQRRCPPWPMGEHGKARWAYERANERARGATERNGKKRKPKKKNSPLPRHHRPPVSTFFTSTFNSSGKGVPETIPARSATQLRQHERMAKLLLRPKPKTSPTVGNGPAVAGRNPALVNVLLQQLQILILVARYGGGPAD